MKDLEEIIEELKKFRAKRIFIQFADGLRYKIQEIVKKIEEHGFECVISLEPLYGACDVRDLESERLDCDVILHIGHSNFGVPSRIPVVYWDYFYEVDALYALKKEIDKLNQFKKIGLITSLQFVPAMEKVKDYLQKIGKEVYVHKSLKYPGQILGCDVRAAKKIEKKVDCFLYVGAGKFHSLGVTIAVKKPVLSLDVEKKQVYSLEKEKNVWLKKKAWYDVKLKDARRIGIIVCWKKGQNRIDEAEKLKKELENKGKEVYILAFDNVSKDKTEGLKLDGLINLACPRLDDELIF
ncbi:MAG: diphthamide biosynthesis enzyme Dph2 [Candidatus Aenigmarchaeota archaeon]|nr:diphthamide biosynthesis enzyme Dph2 [Candidatus Aenigmarchaeota archaeon]